MQKNSRLICVRADIDLGISTSSSSLHISGTISVRASYARLRDARVGCPFHGNWQFLRGGDKCRTWWQPSHISVVDCAQVLCKELQLWIMRHFLVHTHTPFLQFTRTFLILKKIIWPPMILTITGNCDLREREAVALSLTGRARIAHIIQNMNKTVTLTSNTCKQHIHC